VISAQFMHRLYACVLIQQIIITQEQSKAK